MASSAFRQSYRAIFWNIVSIGASFINGVLTARILLPEGRGVLAVILTLGSISALVAGMGTNVSFRAMLPRMEAGLKNYIRVTIYLVPFIIVLGCVVALWSLRGLDFQPTGLVDFATVMLICVLLFLGNQGLDVLNAAGLNSVSAAVNAFGNGLVALFLILFFFDELSLSGVLFCYLLAYAGRQLILVFLIWRIRNELHESEKHSEGSILRLGLKFMGLNVGQAFTFRIDLVFIDFFRGASAAGVYSVAATPAAILQVFSNTIGQVVFRRVADGSFGRREVLRYMSAAFSITVLAGLVIFMASGWVIPFFFGSAFQEAVPLLKLLVVAEVCLSPYLVMSRAAAGLKMTWVASGSGVLGVVVMSLTLFWLVPLFGALGGAYACIITYLLMSLFVLIPVIRELAD